MAICRKLNELVILVRGAGEMATGIAHRLACCHFRVCLTEAPNPQAVRREVAFSEAVFDGEKEVEGIRAKRVESPSQISDAWKEGKVPVLLDPEASVKDFLRADVLIDAILAKRNLGTKITDAALVIGLGPGFCAGKDVHWVVETNRGHNLGRIIADGEAESNTGIPNSIAGYTEERIIRAPEAGRFMALRTIGQEVKAAELLGMVGELEIRSRISGVIRGLLRSGSEVWRGMKMGDIDPRGTRAHCYTISDKARTISGGVLQAILGHFNA
ncbi:MAG: selenium-dependent molybdenum cofactor biosynthesis protein YqeB [bacterium]